MFTLSFFSVNEVFVFFFFKSMQLSPINFEVLNASIWRLPLIEISK